MRYIVPLLLLLLAVTTLVGCTKICKQYESPSGTAVCKEITVPAGQSCPPPSVEGKCP